MKLIITFLFTSIAALSFTSCTVLLAATEKCKPDLAPSDTPAEVHRKLGRPRSSVRFAKAIPLKDTPEFKKAPENFSWRTKKKAVSSREDFVTWGTYTAGSGGFSQQEGYALISGLSLFMLEPVLAPFATINWIFGRFERNEVSVWYSPSGHYVDQHWK